MEPILPQLTPPEGYFYPLSQRYWVRDENSDWIELIESGMRRHLRVLGFGDNNISGTSATQIDKLLNKYQMGFNVRYAGPLAGHESGRKIICGNPILVTQSPKLLTPVAGRWGTLDAFFDGLLNNPIQDQRPYVFSWLQVTLQALYKGQLRPGQALALAGARGSGKSLFQSLLTELLGGRSAKAYLFMTGGTTFNGDLFGAEHLMIEDDQPSRNSRARHVFGTNIKMVTANTVQSCHAKYRQALSLTPFWRLTITLNDEPENLLILPTIEESITDKIMLLKAKLTPMPMPTETLPERELFMATIMGELPHFVHWILHDWVIPKELVCNRFGVTHYHHPELLDAIARMSNEQQLLELIDSYVRPNCGGNWKGLARDLQNMLTDKGSSCKAEVEKLCHYVTACGWYLGRLAVKYPERISCKMNQGYAVWTIKPPPTGWGVVIHDPLPR